MYGWNLRSVCKLPSTGQMLPHRGSSKPIFYLLCDFLDGFLQNPLSEPLSLSFPWVPLQEHHSVEEKSWALLASSGQAEESLLSRVPSVTRPAPLCALVYLGAMQSVAEPERLVPPAYMVMSRDSKPSAPQRVLCLQLWLQLPPNSQYHPEILKLITSSRIPQKSPASSPGFLSGIHTPSVFPGP